MNYLNAEEILLIHHQLIERYGGSHGTRDLSRVESAAVAPSQNIFGKEQYVDIFEKAAVYMRNIISDHPFLDGNKRTATATAVMFLVRNHRQFDANRGEVEDFAVKVAVEKLTIQQIAEWLREHST
jgi:death-on-curing protein